jgi:hypothetical protein
VFATKLDYQPSMMNERERKERAVSLQCRADWANDPSLALVTAIFHNCLSWSSNSIYLEMFMLLEGTLFSVEFDQAAKKAVVCFSQSCRCKFAKCFLIFGFSQFCDEDSFYHRANTNASNIPFGCVV